MLTDQTNNLNQQAVAALNAGQAQQAIALLQPVCDDTCTDSQHWFLLGSAFGMAGNIPAAEQAFRETLRLNPDHLQARTNLGKVLANQKKFDEVVTEMEQVLTINPDHRPARIGLVSALMQLQRYTEAEVYCNPLVNSNQGDAEALTLLGNIQKAKGKFDSALDRFEQALSVDPRFVSAHMNRGLALRSMGNNNAALESFTRASQLAPGNPAIWFFRGTAHIAMNALEQAAQDLEEAFRLNPDYVAAGEQLASVYRHLRRLPESVEVSRRILAVDPDNVHAKFYRDTFGKQGGDQTAQRIPAAVVESTYSQADVGKNFEASLKGTLEYKAPDVLNDAIRDVFSQQNSSLDILELGCGTGLCGSRFADMARTLVGTDLSPRMLDVAREKNTYTDLYVADLIDVLSANPDSFDLIIAMDVLCYFGDLTEIFLNSHDTLRPNGVFAFSVEKPDNDETWLLHPYGHFVHSPRHLQQVATTAGFEELFFKEMVLRREAQEERVGYICLYRRI